MALAACVLPPLAYHASEQAGVLPPLGAPSPYTLEPTVAERTEGQARPGVTITYFSSVIDGAGADDIALSWHRKMSEGVWRSNEPQKGVPDMELQRNRQLVGPGRCGFTWDDAAAKVGKDCTTNRDCFKRPSGVNEMWANTSYTCYTGLPDYGRGPRGECHSINPQLKSDAVCEMLCNTIYTWCDPQTCQCVKPDPAAYYPGGPIQPHDDSLEPKQMPHKNEKLLKHVTKDYDATPSGLPACRWQPAKGCDSKHQYECFDGGSLFGARSGECSATNWFGNSGCKRSCIHVSTLTPAPYYALWQSGVKAGQDSTGDRQPRYMHTASKLTPEARGIDLHTSDVLMSRFCKSSHNHFVGITLFSPKYLDKAKLLLKSCERVGICCKGTVLPSDAFGSNAPEGSEAFRFEAISMKPSFILSQLEDTAKPVVFLDTDLEFYSFPDLFAPGNWPYGWTYDVALFNFWGNETALNTKNIPQIGSAVAFFNQTDRSKAVLNAWAEAMAWDGNARAPDDQVLGLLLHQGGWLSRASFGWLPSSYLHMMPSFYRGVVPVIEHDHGSAPGLIKHSEAKPHYPPIKDMELTMPDHPGNAAFPQYVSPEQYATEQTDMAANENSCHLSGRCNGVRKKPLPYWGPAPPPAPPASPPPSPDLPLSAPSTPPLTDSVCDEPTGWCLHDGAHSKPKLCGNTDGVLVAGHWCAQGKPGANGSLSGFSPCEGPPPGGSEWPHGVCNEDGDALCPGHPNIKLSSPECSGPELQAAPPQAVPKPNPRTSGATMAPYPSGPWQKRNVGSPPGSGQGRGQVREKAELSPQELKKLEMSPEPEKAEVSPEPEGAATSCTAVSGQTTVDDKWCVQNCGNVPLNCPDSLCSCER